MNHQMPQSRSGDTSVLRRLNLQAVLRVLYDGGVRTIRELASESGLSRPTTAQAVEDLVAAGWVSASSEANAELGPSLGRPAQRFGFRPDAGYALGADVGAHKILVLIADLKGNVVSRARREVEVECPADQRLEALGQVIEDAIANSAIGREAIVDAGIATVGSVAPDGTVIYCKTMADWEGHNPSRWVEDRFGFRATGASDMNTSALAEHWRGAAQHAQDIVYLHAGRRLGAALLLGGRPHVGHHSAAAQIGIWRNLAWKPNYDDLMHPEGGAERIFAAAAAGDAAAQARIEAFADDMVQGLAPIIIAVDPELLVIGGGVSAAGEAIAEPLRRRINAETAFPPQVLCSTLGDEAVALGALRLAMDSAEQRLFAELAPPVAR